MHRGRLVAESDSAGKFAVTISQLSSNWLLSSLPETWRGLLCNIGNVDDTLSSVLTDEGRASEMELLPEALSDSSYAPMQLSLDPSSVFRMLVRDWANFIALPFEW